MTAHPRRVPGLPRVLRTEARMWACAARWVTGRRAPAGRVFGYGAAVRPILRIVLALVALEAVVVELLLVVLLGDSPWTWLALAVHLYGLVWILGFLGSLRVLPHRIDDDAVVLRDSVFATVTVPIGAVSGVRAHARGHTGRSGFRVDDGTALLTYGDANVRLVVDSTEGVRVDGAAPPPFGSIDLSVDDRAAFVDALRERIAGVRPP